MSEQIDVQKLVSSPLRRIIGEYPTLYLKPGPVLLVSAGIHGNEPSGIIALQRVFSKLIADDIPMSGGLLGVSGNLAALKKGVRMIDKDLNRICTSEMVKKIRNEDASAINEESEFKTLVKIVEQLGLNENFEQLLFMDLHTTSSESTPFISVNQKESSVSFAKKFPIPLVIGIEKFIPGHFDHYLTLNGNLGFTVEGGQHQSFDSVDHHEAMIWMALVVGGLVEENHIPDFRDHYHKLKFSSLKRGVYEVIYKYQIRPQEIFKMKSGFTNFSKIAKGDLLAWSNDKPVYSEWDEFIFSPLYQNQGTDGFFVVRQVR